MNTSNDAYIQEVLGLILAPASERERFAADLRAHLEAASGEGLSPAQAAARLGSPREVAAEFMVGQELQYAGFWRRLVAFFILRSDERKRKERTDNQHFVRSE